MQTKYVIGLMFSPDMEQIVLIRKNRPDFLAGYLNPVGGHHEEGETAAEGTAREFFEEAGIATEAKDWISLAKKKTDSFVLETFYCKNANFDQAKTMTEEVIGVYKISELKNENLFPDAYPLIQMAIDYDFSYSAMNESPTY